jgi:acyl carrier protein
MTKTDFLNILAEDLEISSVTLTPETRIEEIEEWDSLSAMTTLSIIDEHFGLDFNISQMNNLTSMNDILKIIGDDRFEG